MRYPVLGMVRPALGGGGVASVSEANQGHGINTNVRQINDDNRDQEVNDTNIDPVSPFPPECLRTG